VFSTLISIIKNYKRILCPLASSADLDWNQNYLRSPNRSDLRIQHQEDLKNPHCWDDVRQSPPQQKEQSRTSSLRDELRTNQIQKLWSKTVDRATRRLDSWGPELQGSSSRQLTGPSSLTIMAVTGASNADDDDDSTNDDDLGHFRLETMMPMSSLPAMFGGSSSRIGNKPLPPPKPSNIRLIAAANGVVASLNRCNNNGKPQLQPKPNACARTVPSRLIAQSRSCASKVLPVAPNIADKEPRIQKEGHSLDKGMKEYSTTVVEVGSEELEVQHSLQLTCQPVSELIFEGTDGPSSELLEKSSTAPFPTMNSSDTTNLITVPTPAENITPLVISTSFPVPHFIQVSNTHGLSEKPNTIGSFAGPQAERETLSMVQDDQEDLAGNLCLRKEHRDWVNESPASENAKHDRNLGGFEKEVEWIQDKEEINVEKEEIKQIQERAEEIQQKDGKIEKTNQEVAKTNRIVTIEEQSQNTERKMEQGEEEEGSERGEIIMEQLVIKQKELDNTEKMSAALIGRSCSDKTGSTPVNAAASVMTVPSLTVPSLTVPALCADYENHKFVPTSLNLTSASKNECIPNAGKPLLPGGEMTNLASSPVDSLASLETISNILDQGLHSLQHRKHSVGSRKDSGIGLEDFSPTWEQDIEEEAISEEDSGDVLLSSRSEEEEAALKTSDPPPRRASLQRSQLPVPANRSAPRKSQPDSGRSTPSGARSFGGPSSGLRQPAVYFNLGPRPFYSAASGSQSLLSLPVVRTCHGSSSNKTANSRGSTTHLHHMPRQNLSANLTGRHSSSNFLSGWSNRSPVTHVPSPTYRSSYGSLSCIDLHQGLTASLSSSPDDLLVWEGGSGRSTPSCRRPLSGSRIPLRMVSSSGPRRASLPPTSLASQDSGHFWPTSEARNVWKTSSVHEVSWSTRGMVWESEGEKGGGGEGGGRGRRGGGGGRGEGGGRGGRGGRGGEGG
jgi:hypothetical protein